MFIIQELTQRSPDPCVAESDVHRSMKAIVRAELEGERYAIVEEPLFPPGRRVSWSSYRPDLFGYRRQDDGEEIVLVECETHPNMRRLGMKKHDTVALQSFLFRESSVRRILAVPQGRLGSVDMSVRSSWEVWVVGRSRVVQRAGTIAGSRAPGGPRAYTV